MKETIEYKILNEKLLNLEKIVFGNSNTLGLINSLEKSFKCYEHDLESCKEKVLHCDEESKSELRSLKDRIEILENWIYGITISDGLIKKSYIVQKKIDDELFK